MPDVTAARPAAGAPIATDWGQQIHDAIESILGARAAQGFPPSSSFALPYNVYTLIPGSQLTGVTVGPHVVIASIALDSTSAGFGTAAVKPYVDGVGATGDAVFIAAAAGYRASVAGVWLVNVTGAGVVELRGLKSINAGTVQAVTGQCNLVVI